MGSKTWLKHGKHGSSDCFFAGGQTLHLVADCYHVDEMKFTELLITDQISDALLKL